ncbi:hypothetical protein LTS14_006628 [Recurvomyces mirabilis]|uniref:uncharacterized protein n=1 Tax=Recurvomyces mirabilis TaxID=574656 RepID=UPI002DE16571|nr:hypothetical protein LTS14_006628 [Recurvomyces mirabilis]
MAPSAPPQPRPPRRVIKEEDECPVCGIEMPAAPARLPQPPRLWVRRPLLGLHLYPRITIQPSPLPPLHPCPPPPRPQQQQQQQQQQPQPQTPPPTPPAQERPPTAPNAAWHSTAPRKKTAWTPKRGNKLSA